MFFGDNPISAVEMPPMTRRRSYNLTIAQAKALLNLMEYPEREVTLITISTGMSVSEICALQWKHVNLDQSMVCCGDTWIPPRSILVRKETQVGEPVRANGSRTRCISVSEALFEALRELKHYIKASDPNSFVIATRGGGQLSPVNPREMRLKRVGKDLDIPWLSWQVLKRAHEALLWQLRSCLTEELVLSAYCRSSERLGGWGIATQFTEVTALSPPAASNSSSYWQTPR
jgi:integrase